MPEPTYPGAYIEETSFRAHAVDDVPTSMTAFVGRMPGGPVDTAIRIASVADLERTFGRAGRYDALATAVRLFFANGGSDALVVRPSGPAVPAADDGTGVFALGADSPFNLLCLPGLAADLDGDAAAIAAALAAASEMCETRRAMLVIDPLPAWREVADVVAGPISVDALTAGIRGANAAVYFPDLTVGAAAGAAGIVPPSGAVAGVIARTDLAHGVWKAPAGLEARISGADRPAAAITDREVTLLAEHGVNAIRTLPGSGTVVWGARTLHGATDAASDWEYVPVRRLALFIEASIDRGINWAVFETNDERLWAALRASIDTFLAGLWRQGAFRGRTGREAWFVKCGPDTMTQQEIEAGLLNIVVGFAPLKPAEFVIINNRLVFGDDAEGRRPPHRPPVRGPRRPRRSS